MNINKKRANITITVIINPIYTPLLSFSGLFYGAVFFIPISILKHGSFDSSNNSYVEQQ